MYVIHLSFCVKPLSHMHYNLHVIWILPGGAVCVNRNDQISQTRQRPDKEQTLPASCMVQSQCNVLLSLCLNTACHFLENSQ